MPANTPRPDAEPSENTVERAYAYVMDRTVGFVYRPGERIKEGEVATALEMSRSPVREALNRLVADGLVDFVPRRGFFCRRLSTREIGDLYDVRTDLEVGAVRRAANTVDADALAALRKAWQAVTAEQEAMSIETLVSADECFHLDLVVLAGNSERQRLLRNINARIRFVRHINLEESDRRASSLEEHAPILEAVAAGNAEQAAALMTRHLSISSDEIMRHVNTGLARIYADEVA